jgi:hypothetical protein
MIKETKVMKETTVKERFCDVCGAKLDRVLRCSVASCTICNKDLCDDCVGNEEHDWGDYRHCWCKRCWEIGKPYREEIQKHERIINQLDDEWRSKCKEGT